MHPAGTVFVAQVKDDGITVTEWNLATRSPLRRGAVPLPEEVCNVHVLPVGDGARLMAWRWNGELYYAHLDEALQTVRTEKLGQVYPGGPNAFAADDDVAVILAEGVPDAREGAEVPGGFFAMSFDATGNRVAKRMLAPNGLSMGGNLAVVHGQIYVALNDEDYSLRLLQLTRDLRTVRQRKLPYRQLATLDHVGDALVLDVLRAPDLLEVSLDLSRTIRRPRPAPTPAFPGSGNCGPPLQMGPELITQCDCGPQTCLAWAPLPP
jgi:hypothetical protein